MTEFSDAMEFEADDMMSGVIDDAMAMSPTLTPFVSLGTSDPAEEILDGPTSPHQAKAHDLFETFDNGDCSEDRMKKSGLFHSEEALDL
jgi:hypothetical protein